MRTVQHHKTGSSPNCSGATANGHHKASSACALTVRERSPHEPSIPPTSSLQGSSGLSGRVAPPRYSIVAVVHPVCLRRCLIIRSSSHRSSIRHSPQSSTRRSTARLCPALLCSALRCSRRRRLADHCTWRWLHLCIRHQRHERALFPNSLARTSRRLRHRHRRSELLKTASSIDLKRYDPNRVDDPSRLAAIQERQG